jgi:hypothetical protein
MNHPTFSSETIQAICEALQRAGVEFAFGIRDYGMVWLEPAHIPALLHDREAFEASCVGVSLRDYRRWQESGGEVYCAALTRRGRRCENLLARGLPPRDWVESEQRGDYCEIHSGDRL